MYQPQITIIGAGIVGLSTALALLQQGMKHVTVLEQAQVDHKLAASHGTSRLLRYEYGADQLYSEMVHLSLKRWLHLERYTQQTLYTPTGILTLGREEDSFPRTSYHVLREMKLSPERLTQRACLQRFPQFNTQNYTFLLHNMDAGMLHASTCLHILKQCILDLGGTICEDCRVTHIQHDQPDQPIRLLLSNGQDMRADRIVVAAGPWVHRLLAHLHLPIRLTRQYLLYFADLPPQTFGVYAFPAFMADDLYGFPIYSRNRTGPHWLKAASHEFGTTANPDVDAEIEERTIKKITRDLRNLIPALYQARLAHIEACVYDVSPDESFILDRLPDDPRIVLATGLSGHGFKFGPLLGELLSSIVRETEPVIPLERFALSRFSLISMPQTPSVA